MFKKLRNRFLVLNMAITSLVIVAAFIAVYVSTYNNIQQDNRQKLLQMSGVYIVSMDHLAGGIIAGESGPSLSVDGEQGVVTHTISADYVLSFSVETDSDGNLVGYDSFIDLPQEFYQEAAALSLRSGGQSGNISLDGKPWLYSISPAKTMTSVQNGVMISSSSGHRITFLDVTASQKTLRDLLVTFAIVGVAVLFVIFGVSLLFANRSIKPISLAWDKQRQFIADASHELKTPLSVITANYDVLMSDPDKTVGSQREWLGYMKIGMDRMNALTRDLLSLAKMESTHAPLGTRRAFDMSAAVGQEVNTAQALALEKGIELLRDIEPRLTVTSDEDEVRRVLGILLDNALKYTGDGGEIAVTLAREGRYVVCSVRNTGQGIAPPDVGRVFDRFYRADNARSGIDSTHSHEDIRSGGGYGLGLAIAKAAVGRLGGKISAESEPNGYTTFTFRLDS